MQGKKEELQQLLSLRMRTVLAEYAADTGDEGRQAAALSVRRDAGFLASRILEDCGFERVAMVMGWRKMLVKR